jgi:hypothetical protein
MTPATGLRGKSAPGVQEKIKELIVNGNSVIKATN